MESKIFFTNFFLISRSLLSFSVNGEIFKEMNVKYPKISKNVKCDSMLFFENFNGFISFMAYFDGPVTIKKLIDFWGNKENLGVEILEFDFNFLENFREKFYDERKLKFFITPLMKKFSLEGGLICPISQEKFSIEDNKILFKNCFKENFYEVFEFFGGFKLSFIFIFLSKIQNKENFYSEEIILKTFDFVLEVLDNTKNEYQLEFLDLDTIGILSYIQKVRKKNS